jgi:hypothetical protein
MRKLILFADVTLTGSWRDPRMSSTSWLETTTSTRPWRPKS